MIVLKATQDKVLAVLQSVAGIVERRHTLPILANVLIRKTGNALQLTTSDLEIQIRTTAELGGDTGDFTTTVGARKLIDILKTMPGDQTVSLESSQSKLILKGGKSRVMLQSLPAEDFPLVQEELEAAARDIGVGQISFLHGGEGIAQFLERLGGQLFDKQFNEEVLRSHSCSFRPFKQPSWASAPPTRAAPWGSPGVRGSRSSFAPPRGPGCGCGRCRQRARSR